MNNKGKHLWLQLLLIISMALFFIQCGKDNDDDVVHLSPVCALNLLEAGTYSFVITEINENCWGGLLNLGVDMMPSSELYLPSGAYDWPYELTGESALTFPVLGEVTGSIDANLITGMLELTIDNQPLIIPLDLNELLGDSCSSGEMTLQVNVNQASLCPTGQNVVATFEKTLEDVSFTDPVCNAGTLFILQSVSPPCSFSVKMVGTLQPI